MHGTGHSRGVSASTLLNETGNIELFRVSEETKRNGLKKSKFKFKYI
jgi:hypothetical protein